MAKDEKAGKPTDGPYVAEFCQFTPDMVAGFYITRPGLGRDVATSGIARTERVIEHISEGELRANAHLLAAAWEMQQALAAIEAKVRERLDQGYQPGDYGDDLCEDVAFLCKAALAKSRGEA